MSAFPFTVDENDIVFLKGQWDELLSFYTVDQSIKNQSFQVLRDKYSEKTRFYHNLSHVKALLKLLDTLADQVKDRQAIRFSIWFHDAVYDPKRNDNEEESARFASEMLGKLNMNPDTINTVRALILATKDHHGNPLPGDARLFLDMDLAILGAGKEIYGKYSRAIREEYSWVPEPIYRRGRKKILKSFLDRARIYFTDEMNKRYEEQARKNINDEIKLLEARSNRARAV